MTLVVRESRYLHYDAGAFVASGEACLVDPGILPQETTGLVDDLDGAEVRYVIVTHADRDHILGPEHLPPVPIVAQAIYEHDLDRAPGHAASMLMIYEPREQTLWAADLLSDVEIPSIINDLAGYESTLSHIGSLELRTLVPGHGNPSSERAEIRKRLDEDCRYLDELRASVEAAVSVGASLEETRAPCDAISLRRSEDDETTHRQDVEKVYADLGGDVNPLEVGFVRAWKEATRG